MLIRDTLPEDAKAVSVLVDAVARERRYLAATRGFSEEATASFLASVRAAKGVHVVALVDDAVVGWCDITPASFEGMAHVGRHVLGLKVGFRGRGNGKALLKAAVDRALTEVRERVELEVFRAHDATVHSHEVHVFH